MKSIYRILPPGLTSLLVIAAIAYLSLSSDPMGASHMHLFPGSDKVAHFLMYFFAAQAFICDYARLCLPHHTKLNVELALTTCAMLLGLIMEVGQLTLCETRSFDSLDIVSNCLGAIAGFMWLRYAGGMHRFRRAMLSHRHHHHRHDVR
ncbi:MAG: VanZ family protein [Muribaculaceae bacterium]|nr:VanZ family protein [Muribaculaceae bacterium]